MKNNILIFRSAKHAIVENLIEKICNDDTYVQIYLCVQEECVERYSKYENVKCMVFPNGFFDYNVIARKNDLVEELKQNTYQRIYVPYSTAKPEISEIKKIILKILKVHNIYLCNKTGKIYRKYINKYFTFNKKVFVVLKNDVIYMLLKILGIWYMRGLDDDK